MVKLYTSLLAITLVTGSALAAPHSHSRHHSLTHSQSDESYSSPVRRELIGPGSPPHPPIYPTRRELVNELEEDLFAR